MALLYSPQDEIVLRTADSEPRLIVQSEFSALSPPKKSPAYGWEFPFRSQGFVQLEGERQLRFSVYAQSLDRLPLAQSVCRLLLRLWQITRLQFDLDHSELSKREVEIYLSEGGTAGGEQQFVTAYNDDGTSSTKNTIYIYRLNTFTDPVEMLREVAHEYGHAVIPPIGGFKTPEEWGNGYLGEKLFLQTLVSNAPSGFDWGIEGFGASAGSISQWLHKFSYSLSDKVWKKGASRDILIAAGPKGLGEYQSLMLYAAEAFPSVFGRAIKLARGQKAEDALNGVIAAIGEVDRLTVRVPARLGKTAVYLPLRGAWKFVGAVEIARKRDWIKVQPKSNEFTIVNMHEQGANR